MEAIIAALTAITPLHLFITIFGGFLFGYLYRNIKLDKLTIFFCIVYTVAFSVGRVAFVGAVGTASGAGLVGTILFAIYILTTIITRKLFKGKNIRFDDEF